MYLALHVTKETCLSYRHTLSLHLSDTEPSFEQKASSKRENQRVVMSTLTLLTPNQKTHVTL